MKTAVFLYNPESGKGKIARNVGCISTIFQAYGYDVTPQRIDFTANPFDGNETIDLMVVAGGDGTVNYAVNAMKRKGLDIPIGVIPAGTANDFAGAVGMSREPLEAARQIASGSVERVDCGRVNDLYFVNIFSFGIFTTTSQRTPDERKHKIGKLAYIIEGVKEFRTMHAVPLEIEADGERFDLRSRFPPGAEVVDQGRAVRLHPAGEEEFLSFDAGHVPLSGGRQPEDRPPPPGAADRHPFVGQRTHGRRRAEGRRIPAAHRVSGGRPARDVRQTGLGQFLIFTVRLV